MDFCRGTLIDERYEILSPLGEGGFGEVYRARQLGLDRLVALKFLSDFSPGLRQRFEQEAHILMSLHHRNITLFYGYGMFRLKPYIATELISGITLKQYIASFGTLNLPTLVDFASQLCSGISCAHANGVVHRDLTPTNVLCVLPSDTTMPNASTSTTTTLKIIDFGLARVMTESGQRQQSLTEVGWVVGSIDYMSPEQCIGGSVDNRSDIYSLGCLLFECVAGHPPFVAEECTLLMQKHVEAPIPDLPADKLSAAERDVLQEILRKAMAKSPKDRYQSADSMLADIQALIHRQDSGISKVVPKAGGANSRYVVAIVASFLVLGTLLFASVWALNASRHPQKASVEVFQIPSVEVRKLINSNAGPDRIAESLKTPHSIVDKTALEVAFAERCSRSESFAFLQDRLRVATEPEEQVRLYCLLQKISLPIRGAEFSGKMAQQAEFHAKDRQLSMYATLESIEAGMSLRHYRDNLAKMTVFEALPPDHPDFDAVSLSLVSWRLQAYVGMGNDLMANRECERLQNIGKRRPWLPLVRPDLFENTVDKLTRFKKLPPDPSQLIKLAKIPEDPDERLSLLMISPPEPNSLLCRVWAEAVVGACCEGSSADKARRCQRILSIPGTSDYPWLHGMLTIALHRV